MSFVQYFCGAIPIHCQYEIVKDKIIPIKEPSNLTASLCHSNHSTNRDQLGMKNSPFGKINLHVLFVQRVQDDLCGLNPGGLLQTRPWRENCVMQSASEETRLTK